MGITHTTLKRREKGFTLLEIMVATLVVCTVAIASVQVVTVSQTVFNPTKHKVIAADYAASLMRQLIEIGLSPYKTTTDAEIQAVVNYLNTFGSTVVKPAYSALDVNGDGWITPADSLMLISYMKSGTGPLDARLSAGNHTSATDPDLCTLPDSYFKNKLGGQLSYTISERAMDTKITAVIAAVTITWKEQGQTNQNSDTVTAIVYCK